MSESHEFKRTLGLKDITMYTVTAIVAVDQIAATATLGYSALFWWAAVLILFYWPNAIVTAELGKNYPEEGGIYAWVRNAFGRKWGARVTWFYWANIVAWVPAMMIFFAGIYADTFAPDMTLSEQVVLGTVMCLLIMLFNCFELAWTKHLLNISGYLKIVVVAVLAVGGFIYGMNNGFANAFSLEAVLPKFDDGLFAIPLIVSSILGLELVSCNAEEIKDPERNISRGVMWSALWVGGLYVLGFLGVMAALPAGEIDLMSVLGDTFAKILGGGATGELLSDLLILSILFIFFAQMLSWTIGTNRAAAEAAEEGELPTIFGKLRESNLTPVGAASLMAIGIVGTMVLYFFMAENAEDLFWDLFSFAQVIFVMTYFGMHFAYIKLRKGNTTVEGHPMGSLLSVICSGFLAVAVWLFIWSPEDGFQTKVIVGIVVMIVMGEIVRIIGEKQQKSSRVKQRVS